jgi:hypothetical protein
MIRIDVRRAAGWAASLVVAAGIPATACGTAFAKSVIWSNIPSSMPGNVASVSLEAASSAEFGGKVKFSAGRWKNPKVTVLMSSWACQEGAWFDHNCVTQKGAKFEWPITVSVYAMGAHNAPGAEIGAASKVVMIPYRPSTSKICNSTEEQGGWYDKKEEACYDGVAAKIAIPLKIAELPTEAIIGVSYDTSDFGVEPQRPKPCNATEAGCPYDSLNVGAEDALPEPDFPLPNWAYLSTEYEPYYCESGTPRGTFGLSGSDASTECEEYWTGYQPSIEVSATPAT